MLLVELQNVTQITPLPNKVQFEKWLTLALPISEQMLELTIRIVDEAEITELNNNYRKKNYPTNVLAFPANVTTPDNILLLGDIVICAPVVIQEAEKQYKTLEAHWAHLTIHAALHLIGYDHIETTQAEIMENLEIKLLAKLGFPNPYQQSSQNSQEDNQHHD